MDLLQDRNLLIVKVAVEISDTFFSAYLLVRLRIANFYGHFYYEKIPILKQVHEKFSELAAKRDWHAFGTYAYVKASK